MKKRKILYLFPLAALILSGCTFEEGLEMAKSFVGDKIVSPIKNLINPEGAKKEEGQKPSGEEGGKESEGGGSQKEDSGVTGVKIAKPSEVDVLDGTRVSLKATVEGKEGIHKK